MTASGDIQQAAGLRAILNLLVPLNTLLVGASAALLPLLAEVQRSSGRAELAAVTHRMVAFVLVGAVIFAAIIVGFSGRLLGMVYGSQFVQFAPALQAASLLPALWGVVVVYRTSIRAMGEAFDLFKVYFYALVPVGITLMVVMSRGGASRAVIGVVITQLLIASGFIYRFIAITRGGVRFSFVKANTSKMLLLPVYVFVGLLARLWPRSRKLWVFGRKSGFGEGPLRVLLEVRARHPDFRVVWVAQNDKDLAAARHAGVECVLRSSLAGFLATLRAGVIVITHGLGDISRPAAPGAKIIQLWHGTPLKLISLDSPSTYSFGRSLVARAMGRLMLVPYRAAFRAPHAYVAASELSAQRFVTAFGLPRKRILVTGDPRCDCLFASDPELSRKLARRTLAKLWGVETLPETILMYAPTWRDGEVDPGVPGPAEIGCLAKMCDETGACLIIRSHPWGFGADALHLQQEIPASIRFLPSSLVSDVTPLLHAVDGLITDYSAIAIDYSLLERPIYFFAPDLATYVATRGLYEPYEVFTNEDWCSHWYEVISQILHDMSGAGTYAKRCDRTRAIKRRHHAFHDGRAASRLLESISTSTVFRFTLITTGAVWGVTRPKLLSRGWERYMKLCPGPRVRTRRSTSRRLAGHRTMSVMTRTSLQLI